MEHVAHWQGAASTAGGRGGERLEALTGIVADDMVETLGWPSGWPGRRVAARLCRPAARRLAARIHTCDEVVSERGLQAGAAWSLEWLVAGIVVAGQENVPREGPLLIAANHPGLSDAVALIAAAGRQDLRVVAMDSPFLRAMSGVSEHLIYTPERGRERLGALHALVEHLRKGGAVLLFPAGRIEPDPAVLPGALASLQGWSPSLGLVARLALGTRVVPAIVSGVLSSSAARHPLTALRRRDRDRQRLASLLQALIPSYQGVTVRVTFGVPLMAGAPRETGVEPGAIVESVVDRARGLLALGGFGA